MRVMYCTKYKQYVSVQYCEFFNEGFHCNSYTLDQWNSVRELLEDQDRPMLRVAKVAKPFNCGLLLRGNYSNFKLIPEEMIR
ncbi:MAG TPA: hypothetical protein VMC85_23410 [Desulfomonilaceae bacterium]|nr:hypothetical protein [Desulfomonilaceae bacterium]